MNLDWEKLRLFEAVAEAGSFTEAARRLHISQPALSRQIAALEEGLGAKLFHRHARGLATTHEGEQLRAATHDMQDRLQRAQLAIDASRDRPTGEIRLTTTVSFGSTWLAQQMGDFLDAYPDINLRMMLDDEDLDLSKREADVAIRFHPPLQSELVQKPLYAIRHYLCAAPDYLARHGTPRSIADLDAHRLIAYGDAAPDALKGINWALALGHQAAPRVPALTINNSHAVLQAVEAGAGIAALPTYLIRFSGRVQIVLPEVEGPVFQTYFTYPVELRRSLRVAALRDFLTSRMRAENLDIDRRALTG